MGKKIIFVIFFLLVFISVSFADENEDTPTSLFFRGNLLYQEGKYADAIKEYEKILSNGFESGNLYYNIGNAYFKKSDFGKAALYYIRAKRLMPNDPELNSNYEYLKGVLGLHDEYNTMIWYEKILSRISGIFSIDGLTIFLFILYILTVFVFILGVYFIRFAKVSRLVTVILLLFLSLGVYVFYEKAVHLKNDAVVLLDNVSAKFEPIDGATNFFAIPQGSVVEVIENSNSWSKVIRYDGKTGWVKKSSLELISN